MKDHDPGPLDLVVGVVSLWVIACAIGANGDLWLFCHAVTVPFLLGAIFLMALVLAAAMLIIPVGLAYTAVSLGRGEWHRAAAGLLFAAGGGTIVLCFLSI